MLRRLIFACLLGMVSLAAPVHASDSVDALARDVSRAESFRAVLNLQRSYAQYAQFGLWSEISRLFTANGRFMFDGQITPGEKASEQREITHRC